MARIARKFLIVVILALAMLEEAGAACWWAGRTASPWCDPDSLLQAHAAWHLLGAAALACWAAATLDRPAQARS